MMMLLRLITESTIGAGVLLDTQSLDRLPRGITTWYYQDQYTENDVFVFDEVGKTHRYHKGSWYAFIIRFEEYVTTCEPTVNDYYRNTFSTPPIVSVFPPAGA